VYKGFHFPPRELRKIIPFILTRKRTKHLGINERGERLIN
jgi:hypothetical protein